jgi:magnesium transporter
VLKRYEIAANRIVESQDPNAPILVYVNPGEAERRELIDGLKVDEHTLASALDPDELSRLEFEPDHLAVIFKRPKNYSAEDKLVFRVASTGVFLFKDRLVIAVSEDVSLFDTRSFFRDLTLPAVVLRMIYRSIFHFLEHLRVINTLSDELESKINASMDNRYIINLFALEKSLVYYLNSINSNGVIVEKLKNSSTRIGFNQEEVEFLDDLLIENSQCYRQAEIYSNILASLMDARASIVSNNINVLMKTLNIITIGIMAPTLVVSIFSMNVRLPLQDFVFAFWFVVGLAVLSGFAVWTLWKSRHW